ncbi:hypothetical protein CVT25_011077 [Psilocybe cyanescens]|uniref:Uncharacterized protein n=1 Tax=Psilocybe cyanescens TaxID=93625 RepID=A0A409WFJ5_PSICY|nr:hypothetical protein CVT25_011077 [Psilocybe cyanescens]
MESNLPLIIGLASGFAFLNFLFVFTWFLWERSRRRKRSQREPEDKLTSFNQRLAKLHKARRYKAATNPVPDKWVTPRNGPPASQHPLYISSPLPVHQSPARSAYNHPPGLSSLRTELYPPPPMGITRGTSARTYDTASIYSTISAPSHLHDEILSETHESFSTAVNSEDDHYMNDKYDVVSEGEYSISKDSRDPLYAIQEWEPGTFDRTYWSSYLADDARSGTEPMLREQWPTSNSTTRRAITMPLNIRKRTPTPPFATSRHIPPPRPPRCLSPLLPSPYSP